MYTHSLFRRSLAFAFTLTLAGSAFARRPEPLVAAQTRAESVLGTCEDTAHPGTDGYRDMLARSAPRAPTPADPSHVRLQRMNDHVVLVCEGGRVHGPGGYRDLDVRFRVDQSAPVVALVPRHVGTR